MDMLILIPNSHKYIDLFARFSHIEYSEQTLVLTSPKTLKNLGSHSHFSINVEEIINNHNTKVVIPVKPDKKNNSSILSEEKVLSKPKKNKSRSSKNKHKSDNHDVNKIVNSEEYAFSQTGSKLRKSFVKSKKNKIKSQNPYNSTNLNNFNEQISLGNEKKDNISKDIFLDKVLSIKELSIITDVPEAAIITHLFLNRGVSATVNEILDFEICIDMLNYYGFNPLKSNKSQINLDKYQPKYNTFSNLIERPPIVTILGHVDHGKTTLLDAILNTNVVNKEHGSITQSIYGYEINYMYKSQRYDLTFLDTPGHESFQTMRLRGAKITDIILLVVAIDDGLKPQTIESINYINQMSLSCIVVITKCDKSINNLDKIKGDLAKYNLLCQELGGNTLLVQVSAINRNNIDNLLLSICSLAKSKNLSADPQQLASGTIMDTILDQKQGPITTVVIQNGTLKVGDIVVSDSLLGRIKSIITSSNFKVNSRGPSSVVNVLCFSSIPKAGSYFYCFNNEKEGKKYIANFFNSLKSDGIVHSLNSRISFDNKIARKQLKLIIKADTQGSLEAIFNLFSTIPQSKVQINVIAASCGNITNSDISFSITSQSPILTFNVMLLPQINNLIKKYQINFKMFRVIYGLLEYVRQLMLDIVEPEYNNLLSGNAVVQTVFKTNKGFAAGCIVSNGKINVKSYINVYRNNLSVYTGIITSLKYMKNDVEEVLSPSECGLMSDFQDWQKSDLIEVYDIIPKEKTL
uniref:Translation initiation factor IF-2, chloroplastic n=1 Tax=Polysiphonia infestans TaxID=2006978 RepID=A0A1Z1MEW4_9FLOR|nr:translation initiation factor 2 [Polysiphonia infestans]ARW64365.1 translation initiation factor 2 [Polysiphonia infestans]